MELDGLDFRYSSNLIFNACVVCKIQVKKRGKIEFIQHHFSNLIFQKSSDDQQGEK
jgi:hypothetical protein